MAGVDVPTGLPRGGPRPGIPDRGAQRWCCEVSWVGDDPCWWCGQEGIRWQDLPADARPLPWATSFTGRFEVGEEPLVLPLSQPPVYAWETPAGPLVPQSSGVAASSR